MVSRPVWYAGMLAAAGAGPYVALNHGLPDIKTWGAATTQQTSFDAFGQPLPEQPLMAAPVQDFGEIFRFDLTPEHILQRWPKVMTVSAETELQGLRVPLVTGPNPDDLVGSLTYYFDPRRNVQRITFQGSTGDPQRLLFLMTQTYRMQPIPSLNAGLYLTQRNRRAESMLRITHPPVVKMTTPNTRAEIVLEINRPGTSMPSAAMLQLLEHEKLVNRW